MTRAAVVTVVIPAFNYAEYLPETINSVLQQDYPVHEIIVVDDGSTDDTAKVVARFRDKVRYIYQLNAGLSAARNTGISHAAGDLIAFLDADDVWYPSKLGRQVRLLDGDPEIGLVYCCVREFDSQTNRTLKVWCEGRTGWISENLLLFDGPAVIAIGSTALVRKSVFEKIGFFDTNLKHSEDWDFTFRVSREYKVGLIEEVLVDYRNHGKNMHLNVGLMEASMTYCFEKAFREAVELTPLKGRAYANLYAVLAASYLHAGEIGNFIRCLSRGIISSPVLVARRLLRRRRSN